MKGFTVRRGLACLAAACVVLATGAVALRPAAAESAVMRVARVEGSGVNLREEPATSGKKLGSLSNGDLLLVLDEKKGDKYKGKSSKGKGPAVNNLVKENFKREIGAPLKLFHLAFFHQPPLTVWSLS